MVTDLFLLTVNQACGNLSEKTCPYLRIVILRWWNQPIYFYTSASFVYMRNQW